MKATEAIQDRLDDNDQMPVILHCKNCGCTPYVMQQLSNVWHACCTAGCEKRHGKNTHTAETQIAVITAWNRANIKESAQ